jgi:phenylacetate-CoA ligase
LTGQPIARRLAELERGQWWSIDRVKEYRDRMLRDLVAVAYRDTAHYRDAMRRAGVEPLDVRTLEDLPRLPVLTKSALRASYPDRITRDTGLRWIVASSSGSTGQNTRVREDAETTGRLRAQLLLGFGWAGWPLGAPHIQTGMSLNRTPMKRWKDRLFRCHYLSIQDWSDERLDMTLDSIRARDIRHLRGYAGSLYLLAKRALERDFDWQMHSIVTWGDNLYDHYRRTIEAAFARRVYDMYGCGEGIYVALQCGIDDNYHLFALDTIAEIVGDDDRPVGPGQTGRVLLTRLHPGAMPFLRYEVGDVAVRAVRDVCGCGRGWPLFGRVQGRDTDVVVTPSGNRLVVHVFTGTLEHFDEIRHFQVVQRERSSILLRIVPEAHYAASASSRIIEALRAKGLADMHIQLELVAEIPLPPSQKRRFVVSELG